MATTLPEQRSTWSQVTYAQVFLSFLRKGLKEGQSDGEAEASSCDPTHRYFPEQRSSCLLALDARFPSPVPCSTPGGRTASAKVVSVGLNLSHTRQEHKRRCHFNPEICPLLGHGQARSTHTSPGKRQGQEGHKGRHQLSLSRATQQNHHGCYRGATLANSRNSDLGPFDLIFLQKLFLYEYKSTPKKMPPRGCNLDGNRSVQFSHQVETSPDFKWPL